MKNFFLFIAGSYFLFFLSCRSEQKPVPVMDFTQATESEYLKLSEWADEVRLVPLDNSSGISIGQFMDVWVGDRDIVVKDADGIYQFDSTGRFVRKLASKGRGPHEFQKVVFNLSGHEKTGRLYYGAVRSSSEIDVIDLRTGAFLDPLIVNAASPRLLTVATDGNLVYSSDQFSTNPCALCIVSPEGKEVYFSLSDTSRYKEIRRLHDVQVNEVKEGFLYKNEESDTLFLIRKGVKSPFYFLSLDEPLWGDRKEGQVVYLDYSVGPYTVMKVLEQRIMNTEDIQGLFLKDYKNPGIFYVMDRRDGSLRKMDRFYFDPFDYCPPRPWQIKVNDGKIYGFIEALKIKDIAAKKKEAGERLTEELQYLDSLLRENDNPVVFIGKVKKWK